MGGKCPESSRVESAAKVRAKNSALETEVTAVEPSGERIGKWKEKMKK